MDFNYQDERFADLQMLRYRLNGFDELSLRQKKMVYYLSKATLFGRDITFDQFGKYNLRIRKMLEVVYVDMNISHETVDFKALEVYLKRIWFSSGIHHHYGCEKFKPGFTSDYLYDVLLKVDARKLPLKPGETIKDMCDELFPVIFDETVMQKRVNQEKGEDLLLTSACNFYDGVTQSEAESFYENQKLHETFPDTPPLYGLNSTLVKENDVVKEDKWCAKGKYSNPIRHIIYWLEKARDVADNAQQKVVISSLITYYQSGNLMDFNKYCIEWLNEHDSPIDFINGFIEVYGDPLGLKGSWEGLVEYIDKEASRRTFTISENAQWFEDNSPVDTRFRKSVVKGVSAKVICAAMLGGDEYPATAIGINLPNADWIRAQYGSKSITISNITDAYNKASKGSGFNEEFVIDQATLSLIEKYGDICDDLHTDLHECVGHGSGQLLPGIDPDALKAYSSTIEEARADLFGLYYIADPKLIELGLMPDEKAYQAQYYTYMMNGLMTQLIRINPGNQLEEAHMRNRALIANWCYENGDVLRMVKRDGKTYVKIDDYKALRSLVASLLSEIQRIKSEGDYNAARDLVERYAVKIDPELHAEVLSRYKKMNLAPYKGFINPQLLPVLDENNDICDIKVNYSESYAHQMLRYSAEYGTLI